MKALIFREAGEPKSPFPRARARRPTISDNFQSPDEWLHLIRIVIPGNQARDLGCKSIQHNWF